MFRTLASDQPRPTINFVNFTPLQREELTMRLSTLLTAGPLALILVTTIAVVAAPTPASACPDCEGQYTLENYICTIEMYEECGGNNSCEAVFATADGCWLDCYGWVWHAGQCRLTWCDSVICEPLEV